MLPPSAGERGSVIWITGLPGAGKTTVADAVTEVLRAKAQTVVQVDGDVVREVMNNDLGYTPAERLENAWRISRLCRMLSSQGLLVVCSTVSLFSEIHDWNRQNLPRYVEIYLRVSGGTLAVRKGHLRGSANVVGVDQPFDAPKNADIVIENEGTETPRQLAERIVTLVGSR
jgi:adenylylsulfate kinase-like enzyme